eukprot:TRINITY_DN901_c0_g1_i1.p1 TRINITY_DN901_c0_g1~~TRINITY_DN901_c0_g1_i1.p1  ORF type:complete len:328 (-),score=32.70 TRINITY_DN901_c0_g1_i1:679-1662(-)
MKIIFYDSILMGIYLLIAGVGCYLGFCASLTPNMNAFGEKHKGKLVGLMVSMYGMSAGIFTQFYEAFIDGMPNSASHFFLCVSIILGGLPFCGAILTYDSNKKSEGSSDKSGLYGHLNGLQILKTPDFYMLCLVHNIISGMGLVFINEVSTIVSSYTITEISPTTYVTVLSVCNFSGRVISGLMIDLLKKWPTPVLYFPLGVIVLVFYSLLLVWDNYFTFLLAVIGNGLTYGACASISTFATNEYFGTKHYGTNLGLVFGLPIFVLIGYIDGQIYDSHAMNHQCFGSECFFWSFVINIFLAITVLGLTIAMTLRYKSLKQKFRRYDT